MFKKLLHGKRKSALLNLTWSGLLCRVVWSVSQLLYLLQRAGHFKFFSPPFFVGLELAICPARSVVADQGSSIVRSSALFAWTPVEDRNSPRSRLAAPCRLRRRHVHNPDGCRSGEARCARNPRAQPRFDR